MISKDDIDAFKDNEKENSPMKRPTLTEAEKDFLVKTRVFMKANQDTPDKIFTIDKGSIAHLLSIIEKVEIVIHVHPNTFS
jgi:hypothetical protein